MKGRYIRIVSDGPTALRVKVYDVQIDSDAKLVPGSEIQRGDVKRITISPMSSDGWIEAELHVYSPSIDIVAVLTNETPTCSVPGCQGPIQAGPSEASVKLCDRHLITGLSGPELAELFNAVRPPPSQG